MPDSSTIPAKPRLFAEFPQLETLPHLNLVNRPTPVERLDRFSERLGSDIWIKRDDLTSPVYGGNKPRKLEFILAEARALGKSRLVTGGGIGTNHGLATVIFGRQNGFQVELLLFEQPVTDHVRQNLRLFHAHQAGMKFTGGLYGFVWSFFIKERLLQPGSFFVAPGGSSISGTLGYVDAGLELAAQIADGRLPEPSTVFVPAGTCGSLAGLALGFKLAGLKAKVVGIQVAAAISANTRNALKLAQKAYALIRDNAPDAPQLNFTAEDITIDSRFFGPGYGHATNECQAAFDLMAETEGLKLDLTYTAKTLAGLQDYVAQGRCRGPVLFWNTFNSVDLSQKAQEVNPGDLPPAFHRFFN
jgi:D-cysteine desulfhydrase